MLPFPPAARIPGHLPRDGTGRAGVAENESCPARACAGRGVSAHGGGCGGAAWLSRGPPQPPRTAGGSSDQETGTEGSEGSESERTAWTLPRGHVLPTPSPSGGLHRGLSVSLTPGAARAPARHAQLNVGHVGRGPRKGGPSE